VRFAEGIEIRQLADSKGCGGVMRVARGARASCAVKR